MRRLLRFVGGLLGAGLCATAAVQVALLGGADALGRLAHQRASRLDVQAHATMEDFQPAIEMAEHAAQLDPDNPLLLELLARMRAGAVAHEPARALWTRSALTQAAWELRTAQAARPSWPYGPAMLAAVKYRLTEEDAELRHALVFAQRYGAAEGEVARMVGEVGLRAWDSLDAPAQAATQAALLHLATTDVHTVDALLLATGRAAQVCSGLAAADAPVPACSGASDPAGGA